VSSAGDANGNPKVLSAQSFFGNTISPDRFNTLSLKLLQYLPTPTVPSNNILSNHSSQASQPTTTDQFTERIDWCQRFKYDVVEPISASNRTSKGSSPLPNENGGVTTSASQAVLDNTWVISPSVVIFQGRPQHRS
jgi:hypothetical protein